MSCRNLVLRGLLILGLLAMLTAPAAFAGFSKFTPTVDGTVDPGYGAAVAVQTTQTQFGDSSSGTIVTGGGGSELDALYLARDDTHLYLMFTGNLEGNGNNVFLFIDNTTEAGGVSGLHAGFAGGDSTFNNGLWNTDGMGGTTFPTGLNVDFGMNFKHFDNTGIGGANSMEYRFNVANFTTASVEIDVVPDAPTGANAGDAGFTVSFDAASQGGGVYTIGFDNSNVAGVAGGTAAANQAAAEGVITGLEIAIPLADIPGTVDSTTPLGIFAGVCSGNGDFWSNQFLPGLATPVGNLGADPDLSTALADGGFVTLGPQVLPFTDDFNVDTSANYLQLAEDLFNAGGSEDVVVTFAFDYGAFVDSGDSHVIPEAPNSPDSLQTGLKLEANVNDDNGGSGEGAAVNLFPLVAGSPLSIPDGVDHRLTFDMWMNLGAGFTTEFFVAGLNTSATFVTWRDAVAGSDGLGVANTGDGGGAEDYILYIGQGAGVPPESNDGPSGTLDPAAIGFPNGEDNNIDPFFQTLFPGTNGAPTEQWVEVEIADVGDVLTWSMNGTTILTHDITSFSSFTSGTPFIGYTDFFASINGTPVDQFALVENLVIEEVVAPVTTSVADYTLYR